MPLWIPPSARDETRRFRCEYCGARFSESQRELFARHVGGCSAINDSDDQAFAHMVTNEPLFDHDREAREWIKARAAAGKKATKGGMPA